MARLLTVVGLLLLLVSIAANFAERQALGRTDFEQTAQDLIADPVIQQQLAARMTDQLYSSVDVQAQLEQRLPSDQKALAGAIAGGLRPVTQRLATSLLQRPRFQKTLVAALVASQQAVIRLLDDKTKYVETSGDAVQLDLRPLLQELAAELPVVPNLDSKLPENTGLVTLFKVDQLRVAQQGTRVLRFVADWIWVLALAAWVGAVFLARDRRKEVRAIAVGFVVVGVLVLLVRRAAGGYVVDQLTTPASNTTALQHTWDILTQLLVDAAWAAIAVGVIASIGVWLVGPSRWGTRAREALSPYLRRPALTYGVAAFLFVLLIVWGPISYVQRPLTLLAFAIVAALGVEALRRTAAREFPDAAPLGVRARRREQSAGQGRTDELERLAELHRQGALTDDEYAAAKAQALTG